MKNKFLVGILSVCVLSLAIGCSSGTEVKVQTEEGSETAALSEQNREDDVEKPDYYGELIAAVKECISKGEIMVPENYDFSDVMLTSGYYSGGTRGYLIEDIDGNGVDELIFGENGSEPDGTQGGIIYDIYTMSDGELVHVLNGWVRNRYYLCENGMIANEGSSGAGNSNYSYFTFDGSKIHLVESVIYDGMKDAENPWFYSTESEDDAENAEPVSEERADEIRGKYKYEYPVFVPFGEER